MSIRKTLTIAAASLAVLATAQTVAPASVQGHGYLDNPQRSVAQFSVTSSAGTNGGTFSDFHFVGRDSYTGNIIRLNLLNPAYTEFSGTSARFEGQAEVRVSYAYLNVDTEGYVQVTLDDLNANNPRAYDRVSLRFVDDQGRNFTYVGYMTRGNLNVVPPTEPSQDIPPVNP